MLVWGLVWGAGIPSLLWLNSPVPEESQENQSILLILQASYFKSAWCGV